MTQKTTFPLVWEISFSAISKVKLKLKCILSQEIVLLQGLKSEATWTPLGVCPLGANLLSVPETNLAFCSPPS